MNTDEKLANRGDSNERNQDSEAPTAKPKGAPGDPKTEPKTLPSKGAEQNGLAALSRSRFRLRRRG
jgi:hypothetical protein